jgi:EAL domain-containing protein (putative c-di-GMP-specific phosphodiesterase class I)
VSSRPTDFIELDGTLIAGIDRDPAQRALVSALSIVAHEIPANLIAEGIETAAELHAAQALGLPYVQGYFTGRPELATSTWARRPPRN